MPLASSLSLFRSNAMTDRPLNGAWSDLAKPSQWVPLACMVASIVGVCFTYGNKIASDEQNDADFKQQIVQTISDMKSNQLPRRVQTLEDQFAANQVTQQSQFQATQAAIAALQVSLQSAQSAQGNAMHDVTVQLGNQSQQIAAMTAQIQFWQTQSDGRHR